MQAIKIKKPKKKHMYTTHCNAYHNVTPAGMNVRAARKLQTANETLRGLPLRRPGMLPVTP